MSKPMFDSLEDLLREIARHLYQYIENGELNEGQVLITLDTFKMAMGEYHALVEAGKVPEEQQYRHDYAKALDFMNEMLGDEL